MPDKSYNPILGKTISPHEGKYFRIVRNRLETRNALSPYQILTQVQSPPQLDEDGSEIKEIKVLKENPQKNIRINSQKELIEWMIKNIEIKRSSIEKIYDINITGIPIKDNTIFYLKSYSTHIGLKNRRGPGNIALVGNRVLESIVDLLDITQNNRFEGVDFEYIGLSNDMIEIYTMKDQTLLDDDMAIVSYIGTSSMDCGIIDSFIDEEHYLQLVKENQRVYSDYTQYHCILKLDYSSNE